MSILKKAEHYAKWPLISIILALVMALFFAFSKGAATVNSASQINSPTEDSANRPLKLASVQLPSETKNPFIQTAATSEHRKNTEKHLANITVKVKKNQSLAKILTKQGASNATILEINKALKKIDHRGTIYPGQYIKLATNLQGQLAKVTIPLDKKQSIFIRLDYENKQSTGLQTEPMVTAERYTKETEKRIVFRSGTIHSSLFKAANQAGISDKIIMEMTDLFAWEVDFIMDIRKGDNFKVFYEEEWLDGEKIGEGKIIAAEFTNRGKTHSAAFFEDKVANISGYYTKDGTSLKKAFLRSPVNFARISSHFNLKRKHPILHKIRAHKGVDYAAGRGTPIKATGQGTVIFKGNKGGYGKTVILKHGNKYTTLYAHLHKFHYKLRKGGKVTQGQIIGYVGSSGLATGPHLHYEFRVNNIHKNPLTVKLPKASSIPTRLMPTFKEQLASAQALFNQYNIGEYALLDATSIPSEMVLP